MKRLLLLTALCLLPTAGNADLSDWELLGVVPDGTNSALLWKPEEVQDYGEGNYLVLTLTVSPVMISGIDVYYPDGSYERDTRYPHKSRVAQSIYDCNRHMIAETRAYYFSGDSPEPTELVYEYVENDPRLYPPIFQDPVFAKICP